MQKLYNPNIKKSLEKMSLIVRQDDALLDQLTRDIFNKKFQGQKFIEKKNKLEHKRISF